MSYTPINFASATSVGLVQLAGDLSGTATAPTVPSLSTKASATTAISGTNSITGGGDLTTSRTLSLVGDAANPGNTMYYGTNASGTKGYYAVPSASTATTTTTGTITLAGDLAGTAAAPSVAKVKGVTLPAAAPTAGQVLTATSGTATNWSTPAATSTATTTTTGTITLAGDLAGTATAPSVAKVNGISVTGTPTSGQVLTANSGTAASWTTPTSGFADPMTTKGDLIVRTATATVRQAVGADTQVLIADAAQTSGVKWGAVNDVSAVKIAGSTMTGKLVVPTLQVTGGTPVAGEVLMSDASGNATWQVLPSSLNTVNRSASYTAVSGDFVIANSGSTTIIITLPSPTVNAKVSVKKINSGGTVRVSASGGVLIDNLASYDLPGQWYSQDFIADGTQWWMI